MLHFLWDHANTSHIARHGITPAEAEQVVLHQPLDLGFDMRDGERRLTQLGETDTGRILVVISTLREKRLRVVTAWPAKARMRKLYEARKADLS